MTTYTRNTLTGSLAPVNNELEKIEVALADKLDRNPSTGQSNELLDTLDANSNRIINLGAPLNDNDAARKVDIPDTINVSTDVSLVFDNISEMKLANLIVGQYVRCKRYYANGALVEGLVFEIQANGAVDGYVNHLLTNANIAVLVKGDTLRLTQCGGVADNEADDTLAMQAMIDSSVVDVLAGKEMTVIIDGKPRITDTINVRVSNNRIPSIKVTGLITYDGVNNKAAFVIGETGEAVIGPSEIDLSIVNTNQSDWSDDNCTGISLVNLNSFDLVRIRRAQGFTNGIIVQGDGSGFSYNNLTLGYLINNKRGVLIKPVLNGWCNENTFIGGRFGVFDNVNSDKTRFGIVLDGAIDPPNTFVNSNVFLKPSFEMNETDAPELCIGSYFRYASNNHVIDCRSEKTGVIAYYDSDAIRNFVEVGFNDADSIGVTDNSQSPDNITTSGNTRHENHSHQIFTNDDILTSSSVAGAGLLSFTNKLAIAQGTDGSIVTFLSGTQATNSVTITDTSKAIGVKVSTDKVKSFNVSAGLFGANGHRGFVVCYDASGAVITTGTPAIGTANNTFSLSGSGFQTGADSQGNVSVKFSDAVKSAFIGIRRGGAGDLSINSLSINAMNTTDGVNRPAIYPVS